MNAGHDEYTIDNMDEPLSLGGRSNGNFFFSGMMDKVSIVTYNMLHIK